MKHISENKREIGKKTYFRTDDPNIIKETKTVETEIHLDKLKVNPTLDYKIMPESIKNLNMLDEVKQKLYSYEKRLNCPVDLTKSELSEDVDDMLNQIHEADDTETKVEYEQTDKQHKRIKQRITLNKRLGYKIVHTREYRHPLNHKAYGALKSHTEVLERL